MVVLLTYKIFSSLNLKAITNENILRLISILRKLSMTIILKLGVLTPNVIKYQSGY